MSADRRVRTTLAHEAGHGLLHAHLFVQSGQCKLFPEGQGNQPRVLCRDGGSSRASTYGGCWWEYQANRAIGAFLLPRTLVQIALDALMVPTGGLGLPTLPVQHRNAAIQRLSTVFDVNPVVARFRLLELLPEESTAQMTL